MDVMLTKKRVYNFLEKENQVQLESLQGELEKIQKNINQYNALITEKKNRLNAAIDKMYPFNKNQTIDVTLVDHYRNHVKFLQDDLIKDEFMAKSLNKNYQNQIKKMKAMFQESKLYQKMAEKNDRNIQYLLSLKEEKVLEELSANTKMESLVHE